MCLVSVLFFVFILKALDMTPGNNNFNFFDLSILLRNTALEPYDSVVRWMKILYVICITFELLIAK